MLTRRLVAIALLATPMMIVSAQRGGGGGGGGGSGTRGDKEADWKSIGGDRGGLKLSNRDVEDISPVKLLIDKRKDLKLSDDQVKGLKDLESKLKEKNAPAFNALDSLRRLTQPAQRGASDDDRSRMSDAGRMIPVIVGTIRENYDASVKEALPLLDDAQRTSANEMVEKQRKEAEDMLRAKMGRGRG